MWHFLVLDLLYNHHMKSIAIRTPGTSNASNAKQLLKQKEEQWRSKLPPMQRKLMCKLQCARKLNSI